MRQVALVVEGNVHAGKLYKFFIEPSGYHAIVTEDPEKALRQPVHGSLIWLFLIRILPGTHLQGWSRGCGALLKEPST
jgi:hypothetical protein